MSYTQNNPLSRKTSPLNKDDRWIQKATASIKERGTEGVCTGDKFGGPTCPPGSKRYTLAKTFKAMAKKGGPSRESSEEKYMPLEDDMDKKGEGDKGMSRRPKEKPSTKPVEETRMTKGDQMPSRKSSSPLNTKGHGGKKGHTHKQRSASTFIKSHPDYIPPVNERSGTNYNAGQRSASTFIKSHPDYISPEDWAARTDEQKGITRKSSSPLNNTGMTGLNYSKELEYMPIEDDMNRGMSRESSEGKQIRSAVRDLRKANRKRNRGEYSESSSHHTSAKETYTDLSDKGKTKAHKKMGRTLGSGKQWIEQHGEGPSRESSSPLELQWGAWDRYDMEHNKKANYGADYGFSRESSSPLDYGSWANEDATRAKKLYAKGDYAHARALGVDEHDADYGKWKSSEAEHGPSRKSRSERLRSRAMKRSERSGAEWGDYDYEDKRVQKMLSKASELDERSGGEMKMMMTKHMKPLPKKKA